MTRFDATRASRRQLLAGILALPLSLLPFLVFGTFTAEGRLMRDRVRVALDEPEVPDLTERERVAIRQQAPRYTDAVMPLVYHGIGESTDGGAAISPERFAEHLAALDAAGMSFVTATDVADAFAGGDELPPNAVMISFDDGRTDAMLWATPLLEDVAAAATMFVITEAAGSRSSYYASWGKLSGHARSGTWDLQSHSAASHVDQETDDGELPVLTSRADGETLRDYRQRVRADLAAAATDLDERVGRAPVAFAYPFGAHGADRTNDDDIDRVLADEIARVHELAFHQDGQDTIQLATEESDRLDLRRMTVGDWSGAELVARIAEAAARTPDA